jgi:hypothetical protein
LIQPQKGNKALIPSLPCSHDHWYDWFFRMDSRCGITNVRACLAMA